MKNGKKLASCSLGVLFLTVFVGWRVYGISHGPSPSEIVLVHDSSTSEEAGCGAVRPVAVGSTTLPGVTNRSHFSLIGTGEKANGYEGRLVKVFDLPVSHRVMEGKNAERRRQEQFGDAVQEACDTSSKMNESPILRAVKDGIDHLRANHCDAATTCYLYVVTDGEENVDAIMRSALNGSKSVISKLRGKIANEGIHVSFCGFAQSKTEGSGRRTPAERLKTVWMGIFTDTSLVTIAPYCRE